MLRFLVVLLSVFVFSKSQNPAESCTTPDGRLGECIIIRQCPSLLDLLQHRPLSSANANLLKRAQCGFEGIDPKVCCAFEGDAKPAEVTTQKFTGSVSSDILPNVEDCGLSAEQKIVGGEVIDIDEHPWMALVEYQKPNNNRGFYCGGVLINRRYVLTAAHCLKGKDLPKSWNLISVRLGEYNTDTDVDCVNNQGFDYCSDPPQNVAVEEQIAHERYDPLSPNQEHDIALLRLVRNVTYSDFIKPICVPTTQELLKENFVNKKLVVAGWGKTENASASNIKLKLEVPVKSKVDCNSVYNAAHVNLGEGQICAGGELGKDSCRGDSGGPLMYAFTEPGALNWFVTGIVSFGPSPCGLQGWPGVYTKVSEYVPWIISKLRP